MNVFIGELPPPYGGVAVKDELLFREVYAPIGVKMINLVECKWKPWKIPLVGLRLIWCTLIANHVIIGVGTNKRRIILMRLRKLLRGKNGLKTTHMMVMGGRIQKTTKEDKRLKRLLMDNGSVWVETMGMKMSLEEQGFTNIKIFPNCREDSAAIAPKPVEDQIKYVYFSRICGEKGVDEIIAAVDQLGGKCSIDFYGEIESSYRKTFDSFLATHKHIKYHGVFDVVKGNVYKELNQYDVMLLPSKWLGEGVPGALVEAKMAGITAVVSDWNYNSEVVLDGIEGIVIHENLYKTLCQLSVETVNEYKKNAYCSRSRYSIQSYINSLRSELQV